ncbi:MAG: dephospho-CoA kinase [Clostridia bacterium]|nr:dephospho-CoA kinase [Clostridia bacterium]
MPGPLTMILPKKGIVPDEVTAGLDSVAIRCPSNEIAHRLIEVSGHPIAAPSANRSGIPSPTKAEHVRDDMDGRIDMIIDGGECDIGLESTVIKLTDNGCIILRPGAITEEMLREICPDVSIAKAVIEPAVAAEQKVESPGMKYKHYSPKARVIIVKGSFENYRRFVSGKKNCAALCFDGEGAMLNIPFIEIGREHDSSAQAHLLFEALRSLDDMGVETAYARCPDTDGVGLAVINRLLRAAAFTVIDVDGAMIIGLTGATGSGKSTVAKRLCEKYGIAHIDCDAIAREITSANSPVLAQLAAVFGEDIILDDGSLDRAALAARAFSSKEATKRLNGIMHPIIISKALAKVNAFTQEGKTAVLLDAAAIFESKIDKLCAFTAVVSAPAETRLDRIMYRDSITREKALSRMGAQLSDEEYAKNADVVLFNYAPYDTDAEIEKIIRKYKEKKL